jgi:prepilin-type N-terminal cleavage/methylation domain-containing protein/prepilin-type processing-associated H-X9-DG protein
MKKAFTLIELLVVIAIIAILAAILFPVFAQAKLSAKKASSLSNIKQLGTAAIMYGADYDDMIPTLMNGARAQARGTVLPRADTWVWMMQPYIKNLTMMVDPGRGDKLNVFGSGVNAWYGNQNWFPMYGMNFLFLSPMYYIPSEGSCGGSPAYTGARYQAKSFTQATDVADTVFFTESRLFLSDDMRGYHLVNAPGMWPIIAPDDSAYCIIWDGNPCSGDWCGAIPKRSTGAVSIFYNQGSNVLWLDGHAKYAKDTDLAKGTDYSTAVPGGIASGGGAVITDFSVYKWNLDDNKQDQKI